MLMLLDDDHAYLPSALGIIRAKVVYRNGFRDTSAELKLPRLYCQANCARSSNILDVITSALSSPTSSVSWLIQSTQAG